MNWSKVIKTFVQKGDFQLPTLERKKNTLECWKRPMQPWSPWKERVSGTEWEIKIFSRNPEKIITFCEEYFIMQFLLLKKDNASLINQFLEGNYKTEWHHWSFKMIGMCMPFPKMYLLWSKNIKVLTYFLIDLMAQFMDILLSYCKLSMWF